MEIRVKYLCENVWSKVAVFSPCAYSVFWDLICVNIKWKKWNVFLCRYVYFVTFALKKPLNPFSVWNNNQTHHTRESRSHFRKTEEKKRFIWVKWSEMYMCILSFLWVQLSACKQLCFVGFVCLDVWKRVQGKQRKREREREALTFIWNALINLTRGHLCGFLLSHTTTKRELLVLTCTHYTHMYVLCVLFTM